MSGPNNNQRRYDRHLIAEKLFCYIDGDRFDARSRDISAGGLFIRTPKNVPLGVFIALVFKDKDKPDSHPIFLVGKVVRHQQEPVKGIGLQWDRAITEGSSAQLELFLTLKMGIIPHEIFQETGPRKETRHVFDFTERVGLDKAPSAGGIEAPPPVVSPELASPPVVAPPEAAPQSPREKLRTVEPVHVIKSDGNLEDLGPAPLPEHVVRLSDGAPGPLSSILQRGDSLAPVTLNATVEIGGKLFEGVIRGMSVKTMFLTGLKGLGSATRPFKVTFSLPAKADRTTITCTCRVLYDDPGDERSMAGLELEIDHYDEGGSKGILWTYLKWVTFRQIRGQEESTL